MAAMHIAFNLINYMDVEQLKELKMRIQNLINEKENEFIRSSEEYDCDNDEENERRFMQAEPCYHELTEDEEQTY